MMSDMPIMLTDSLRDEVRLKFRNPPESYNCAQAVMALTGREEACGELRGCGGGNAPGGLCGALYAALLRTPAEHHDDVKKEFAAMANGATTCREVKTIGKFPCLDCVATATLLVRKYGE